MRVKLWGAGGAGGAWKSQTHMYGFAGGSGGFVSCNMTVTAGRVLVVIVGGGAGLTSVFGGYSSGGYGGGGQGWSANTLNSFGILGGGGGRSALQVVSGVDAVTAGGGGGGGSACCGYYSASYQLGGLCGGGLSGCASSDSTAGASGTQSQGGAAGGGGTASGSQYQGGSGSSGWTAGGGGGYFGGGGGGSSTSANRGAGGGSGYTGGCVSTLPVVSAQGSSGTSSGVARPAYYTDPNYMSGVGVGSAGTTSGYAPVSGGNGLVWIEALTCPAGSVLSSGMRSCVVCAAGSYGVAGATACTLCPSGTLSTLAGASNCKTCSAGDNAHHHSVLVMLYLIDGMHYFNQVTFPPRVQRVVRNSQDVLEDTIIIQELIRAPFAQAEQRPHREQLNALRIDCGCRVSMLWCGLWCGSPIYLYLQAL